MEERAWLSRVAVGEAVPILTLPAEQLAASRLAPASSGLAGAEASPSLLLRRFSHRLHLRWKATVMPTLLRDHRNVSWLFVGSTASEPTISSTQQSFGFRSLTVRGVADAHLRTCRRQDGTFHQSLYLASFDLAEYNEHA